MKDLKTELSALAEVNAVVLKRAEEPKLMRDLGCVAFDELLPANRFNRGHVGLAAHRHVRRDSASIG